METRDQAIDTTHTFREDMYFLVIKRNDELFYLAENLVDKVKKYQIAIF